MIQFICYFFPAIIAVWLTELFTKENFDLKKCIYHFCLYTIIINSIIYLIIALFFAPEVTYLPLQGFSYLFTIKYLAIALVLAFGIAFLYKIIKNNISISLEITEPEIKNEERKTEYKKKNKK